MGNKNQKEALSIMENKDWLNLSDCIHILKYSGKTVSKSDLFQFAAQGILKLSIYVPSSKYQLAKELIEYCPLPDNSDSSCIYSRVARKYLEGEIKQKSKNLLSYQNLIEETTTETNAKDLFSEKLLSELDKEANLYQKQLASITDEVFLRWKNKGTVRVGFEYGATRLVKGIYKLYLSEQLQDWLIALSQDRSDKSFESNFPVLCDDELGRFILWDDSKPSFFSFSETELIVQPSDFKELETSLFESNDVLPQTTNKQQEREAVLSELIKSQGMPNLKVIGRDGVWNELAKIDKRLFFGEALSSNSTLKKFFDAQELIAFEKGRKKGKTF